MAEMEFNIASYNRFLSEKRLMAAKCKSCGALYLPPRPICIKCHGGEMEWVQMTGEGKLVAFTTISVGLPLMIREGYDRTNPYCTGIVELKEGPKISARILGVDPKRPEQIKIGTPVSVEFLERGEEEEKGTFLAFKV